MKLEFSGRIIEKFSKFKFHENPFSGGRVAPYVQIDMTKLIVTFRNFAKTPKYWNYV
jgi:hypothetical protein